MRTFLKSPAGPLVFFIGLIGLSSSAFAGDQQHAVDPSALVNAVTQHVAQQDADRAAIREALGRPEVRDVAAKAGVDPDRAAAAVGTLSGLNLDRAAATARQVNESLIGGSSTVVISTTTLIIILLVVLILVVH
jgi:hypothetical protein